MQRFRRTLCGVDEALPFPQWRGMNPAQREPAVAIRQRDGEILRVLRDVGSNALPADRSVLATKVVIICRHREATMARLPGNARPAGKPRKNILPPRIDGGYTVRGSSACKYSILDTKTRSAQFMRYLPTLCSGAVCLISITMTITSIIRLTNVPKHSFAAPGIYHYPVDKPGEHTVWLALNGVKDGEMFTTDEKLPPGMRLSVTHEGNSVPVRAYNAESESTQGQTRKSVAKFTANSPGDYLVSVSGLNEAKTFQISSSSGIILFFQVLAWIGGTFLSGVLFIVFLLFMVTGVFPKKTNTPVL
jgi:hypothetical protein